MAEGGDSSFSSDDDSVNSTDSEVEETLSPSDDEGQDEEESDEEDDMLKKAESAGADLDEEPEESHSREDEKEKRPRCTVSKVMAFVNDDFYGCGMSLRYLNILTDFVDAEVFLIDGDSLLLELLGERSLDWSHGGQFLHLTYLFERFLQYFTDKDGVFHIVFFEDMEFIWSDQPSMLLARQAIILHLQHNTAFTVITTFKNCWESNWRLYLEKQTPAFLLLSDAETCPWNMEPKKKRAVEFFFRALLGRCLKMGLNCVYISDIQLTNSKVMGFYAESSPNCKRAFTRAEKAVFSRWCYLVRCFQEDAKDDLGELGAATFSQCDLKGEVERAVQSSEQNNCRLVASTVACTHVMQKVLDNPDSTQEIVKATEYNIKLFLLHAVLLNKLPLKYRSHALKSDLLEKLSLETDDGKVYPFQEIHVSLWRVLKFLQELDQPETQFPLDMSSVSDIMDGRLVLKLLTLIMEQQFSGMEVSALTLPEEVIKEAEDALKTVLDALRISQQCHSVGSLFLPLFAEPIFNIQVLEGESSVPDDDSTKPRTLLNVENPLVDLFASDLRSKINALAEEDEYREEPRNTGREFDELYHWHSLRPLSDDHDRTKQTFSEKLPSDPKERRSVMRQRQKYVDFQKFYGNSLEGGIDRAQTITLATKETEQNKKTLKKEKLSKKAKKIIEDNKEKQREQDKEKDEAKWSHVLGNVEVNVKENNFTGALQAIDPFQASCKTSEFRLQALMKKAECCWDAWKHTRSRDSASRDVTYPVLVMESVQKIADEFGNSLSDKNKRKLARYMEKLGFTDIASTFCPLSPESGNKKQTLNLSVHTTSARFQMEHMGHLLKRDDRKDPDPRVQHFIPDAWQRELLDAVDNKESAVIVAPTSSGKTFASYYCMEKVLRESNDGIVVYVSPTKALVNQVAATIYARFRRKKLPEGRAVYGVFTRDYRHNALNSQILVTVPQCLEILLLSPRRQDWAKNLKYVIFDEVHCLGGEIGAEVWEHLLLLIRCPFLALSATIGNPEDLKAWLQNAQDFRKQQDKQGNVLQRRSYRVRLVTYSERYSDLEKCIYLPSDDNESPHSAKSGECGRLYDRKSSEDLVRLHPCSLLGTKQLQDNGFPGDMSLTPKESLELYDAMIAQWSGKDSLVQLAPEKYFQEIKMIYKKHARQYENDVKKELKSWADGEHLDQVKGVICSLSSICPKKAQMLPIGKDFILDHFVQLVEQLRAQEKLPALVFSFDRVLCQTLSAKLTFDFKEREHKLITTPGSKYFGKFKKMEKEQGRDLKQSKRRRDRKKASPEESLEDQDNERDFSALKEPLPECSLVCRNAVGNDDLRKIMNRIRYVSDQNIFKSALLRGVSYHHAGLNNKQRSVVEMLFRTKYLQVVAATGTLALGIHMPCKTVVFAGDSPFLNSLQYRQMSGRAGRRGFDPVGNVVFFGVPYKKIKRLITANIPKLVGNFPISVSLVLRLLLMTSKGDDKKDALTKALTLLSHPFICQQDAEMRSQIKGHFLFSVELLAQLSLINLNGVPQEMAGLVTHLHYHEPSNFVLVSFLQRGLFHNICLRNPSGKFSQDVMRQMVLVLSHLFGRRPLHPSYKRRIDKCPSSKVVLEDLPEPFAEAINAYNHHVTKVFKQYLTTMATELQQNKGEERSLPLSGIVFPSEETISGAYDHDTIKSLVGSSIRSSTCSSFVTLSGNSDERLYPVDRRPSLFPVSEDNSGDENESDATSNDSETQCDESDDEDGTEDVPINQLLKIVRQGVYTDMNVVPVFPVKSSLNAYALDFFKHGSSKAIINENKIQAGEVFTLLKDFYLAIKSISCSLEELGPEKDNVVLAFKQLSREYGEKFNKRFPGRDV